MQQKRKPTRKSAEERGMEMDEYIKKETVYRAIMGERPEAREPSWFAELVLEIPAADVAPVRHGRWERCGGDLHSSGYVIYCSVCNKTHFVHYKYSLGGLYGCKELFEKPKHCPSCGAFMEVEE